MTNRITIEELFNKALLSIPKTDVTVRVEEDDAGGLLRGVGGVYIFYNRYGEALYIGISRNVRKRIADHMQGNGNADLFRYLQNNTAVTVSVFYEPNIAYREVYEGYLIHLLEPRYNVAKTGRIRM